MSLDASLKMDLFAVDSDGKKLERVKGPGLVGLTNLGNTCYMNSCLQLLFSLPETRKRYLSQASDVFLSASSPVSSDLNAQMCKLAVGLLSTRNCLKGESEDEEGVSVRPRMFKSLIGKGHTLFSTNKQPFYTYQQQSDSPSARPTDRQSDRPLLDDPAVSLRKVDVSLRN